MLSRAAAVEPEGVGACPVEMGKGSLGVVSLIEALHSHSRRPSAGGVSSVRGAWLQNSPAWIKSPHPDPAKGVFETMLVADGRPVELGAHMARLGASLEALFGAKTPEETAELVSARAHGIRPGTAAADGGAERRREAHDGGCHGRGRSPARLPDRGSGRWNCAVSSSRRGSARTSGRIELVLENAEAEAPAGSVPLLLDSDGVVLEASRASVFAVREGAALHPLQPMAVSSPASLGSGRSKSPKRRASTFEKPS